MCALLLLHVLVGLQVLLLEAEAHLNTSFKHFTFFITEFAMIQDRELAPMMDLIHRNLVSTHTFALCYAPTRRDGGKL